MNAFVTHLWTSTLVLFVALLAARFLPLSARTRYAVLLCGLFKFVLPATVATAPLHSIFDRKSIGTIAIAWIDSRMPIGPLTPSAASNWPMILRIAWIVPAVALAASWLIARRRIEASALRGAATASPREHAALDAARRHLQMRRAVDVMRSPICEAPVVMRIIRPVIVLPDGGCDSLDSEELEALLRHECAHVARADNAFALVESAIVAAFWFHPLIWIAQRAIASAREQACDETAASTPDALDTYVSALSKICNAALSPSTAGVSCMASAHLKERLYHLMRYDSHRALSHRLVLIVAAIVVAGVTLASDIKPTADASKYPYNMFIEVHSGDGPDSLVFSGRIVDATTNRLFAEPNVAFKRGGSARIRTGSNDGVSDREAEIDIRDLGSSIAVVMRMTKDGVIIQESNYQAIAKTSQRTREYSGEPISLNLKDADIKDVLRTFKQLTGTNIEYPDTLEGKVTINVREMPWDEAFEAILRDQHLTWEMQGKTITIKQK